MGGHYWPNSQTLFKSVIRQNIAYFDYIGRNEITRRIHSDMKQIQEILSENAGSAVLSIAAFCLRQSWDLLAHGVFQLQLSLCLVQFCLHI